MDKLDWIENQTLSHMRERENNWQIIDKQATQLLLLLLAGGGGSFMLAISNKPMRVVLVVLALWFFAIAIYLVYKCFVLSDYPCTFNEPKNFKTDLNKDWDIERLRWAEINGLQKRIDQLKHLNYEKSLFFNRALIAVCCTPIIVLITWQV